jgi:hypothetical protein
VQKQFLGSSTQRTRSVAQVLKFRTSHLNLDASHAPPYNPTRRSTVGRLTMQRTVVAFLAFSTALLTVVPAGAHHSNVAYEVTKVMTITGVVKEFRWVNPHTWLIMTVDDGKGGKVEWAVEGRAPGVLLRAGWTRSSMKPGETVTVDLSRAKDGTPVGIIARVTKADGSILSNQPAPQ